MGEQPLIASAITPGKIFIYLLHGVLTSLKHLIGDLVEAHEKIDAAQVTGFDMARQCLQKMQLFYAVNMYACKLKVDFVSSETSEVSAERYNRVEPRTRGHRAKDAVKVEEVRNPGPLALKK